MKPAPPPPSLRQRLLTAYRTRRWVRWGTEAVVLVAIVLAVGAWQTRNHLTGEAPPFRLPVWRAGDSLGSTSLRGKPTMLVFWAPWCSVCKAQAPNVSWVRSVMKDGANVVSVISSFQSLEEVDQAVRAEKPEYPVLLDIDGVAQLYRVKAFPTVYFLDAEGRVRHTAQGYTTGVGLLGRLWASSL